MNIPVLFFVLGDFAMIGVLPRVFFKRGSFNSGWWLTAAPFFCCPVFLVAAALAGWHSWAGTGDPEITLATAGLMFAGCSIALIFLTIGTHRVPLALWHQEDDAPASIVTYGAYARIRHPFYAAFLLAFLAAFTMFPHVGTALPFVYAAMQLNATAAREERRLAQSEFGAAYREYLTRTGRFFPVLVSR
jgi:protein-S-isoprenylcysteine O-methyltransferase Ste14